MKLSVSNIRRPKICDFLVFETRPTTKKHCIYVQAREYKSRNNITKFTFYHKLNKNTTPIRMCSV